MQSISNRDRLMASTLIAGAAFTLFGGQAFAQSKPACDHPDANGNCPTSQDVVVTGSRIKRDSFTAPDPIQVITQEQAALTGYADTASLLQQSAIAAGSFQTNDQLTGYVVGGGPGNKTLSLSRLGAQRTILLLDGKRLGPAGVGGTVGPVDLDVISEFSIDHVEVLRDGASSIYGSDAVAGVVNIITKKNHDGGLLTAYTSQSEHGGGNAYQMSGEFGKSFDRGYIDLGAEYFEQDRLSKGQRSYTNCSEDYVFDPATGLRRDYTDTVTYNDGHFYKCYNSTNNDIAVSYAAQNPRTIVGGAAGLQTQSATIQYLQPGVAYPGYSGGNDVPSTISALFARQARAGFPLTYPYANYTSPYIDRASIISPDRHYNVNFNAGYDFNATTHLYAQFQFSDRVSSQQGARQLFPSLGSAWIAGNPNNIFAGTGVTPVYPIIELPSDYTQNVKYYRGVIGLKGDFTNVGWFNRFSYDVYGVYSRSDADYSFDGIYNDRVVATTTSATNCNTATVNLSGYSCATAPNIPWLSQRIVSGQFTQAERDFLFFKTHGSTQYDQYILEGDVTGDLFTLPAGAVGAAIGVSYRHDKINDTPDPQTQLGNLWGQTAAGHTAGSDAVKEIYAELTVPVIKNVPLIQNLTFDLSGRYSDYDSYGNTTTYKASGNWTVIPDLRFRGSIGTSFRAPALYELYLAHQTSFSSQTAVDPCINYGSSGVSTTIQTACAALGISSTYNGVQNPGGGASAQISTGGGKGNLQAETSQAKSIGVVLQPKHFGIDRWTNLSISVDYTSIVVHDEVSTFGTYNIISQCLRGNTGFCGLFVRDMNPASATYFNILTANNNYVNVASQSVRFMDVDIAMSHNFGRFGKISAEAKLYYTLSDKSQLLGSSGVTNYNGGTYNYDAPDFTGNANLRWDFHDWTVFWNVQGIGKGSDAEFIGYDTTTNTRYSTTANISVSTGAVSGVPTQYKYHTEAKIYHDLSVQKRLPQYNAEVIIGVKNLFDETPPVISTGEFRAGNSGLNGYDMIGRSFFGRVTKKF